MFWQLTRYSERENLSYIIAKHPDSVFDRTAGPGRQVVAKFSEEKVFFEGHVENDPLIFLETARKLNMSNYVHTQLSAVCPHNLKGFDTVFRSVLRGKNAGGITDEQFAYDKGRISIIIGPYPLPYQQLEAWFVDAGMAVQQIDTDTKAVLIQITSMENMTVTEFLQKIYLISYYITQKHVMVRTQDKQIEKFVTFCSGWINKMTLRNRLVNGLCHYRKGDIKKFETDLLDCTDTTDEEAEDRMSAVDEFINRVGLHDKRHNIIIEEIPEWTESLLELGCGGGRFLSKIAKKRSDILEVHGIEINGMLCRKVMRKRELKYAKVTNSSILYPNVVEADLCPDFMAFTEVLEHIDKPGREHMIKMIKQFYVPAKFVITVPNLEFNVYFDRLEENGYRHPAHKTEYTEEQLFEEIVEPLQDMYNITVTGIPLDETDDRHGTPTWIVIGKHKEAEGRDINHKMFRKIKAMYDPIYLPISDYNVNSKEISAGYSSRAYEKNGHNIFYLAHTMSPVDYTKSAPDYLEHPEAAFEYYRERGVLTIHEEEKYMGSRGYLLAFRDPEQATKLGYNYPLIINSRGGYTFFHDEEILAPIHEELVVGMESINLDFVMLDCEIMPWAFKGARMIENEFQIPAECALLSREWGNYSNYHNAEEFLKTLKNYSEDGEIDIKAFNLLAMGQFKDTGRRVGYNRVDCGLFKDRDWHYNMMFRLFAKNGIVSRVKHNEVNLYDRESMDRSINRWKIYCDDFGGEGFVYKIDNPITYFGNGFLVQPCVKVRGKKYLQLIYGIDYLEPEYFEKVTHRSIKRKRLMAVQEHEMGINILRTFLSRNLLQHKKHVAGFIGMSNINSRKIDATL